MLMLPFSYIEKQIATVNTFDQMIKYNYLQFEQLSIVYVILFK